VKDFGVKWKLSKRPWRTVSFVILDSLGQSSHGIMAGVVIFSLGLDRVVAN
jgi:hypothetical protein